MKIRSITYFLDPGWPPEERKLKAAGDFLADANQAYESAGYEVQTTRLATTPFPHLLNHHIEDTPRLAASFESILPSIGVDYVSLGPALMDIPDSYEIVPEALAQTQNVFFSGEMADRHNGISLKAVQACADVIARCAPLTPDGFTNLRFAALANVQAGAPFFPAAYHQGRAPAFAIATEAADLAVEAFTGQSSLAKGRKVLVTLLEKHGKGLTSIANRLSHQYKTTFGGIDFSLAPFPAELQSLGGAVERMGVPVIGNHGSIAAAALLTEAIERAEFHHAGFCGFMQPVLEDAVLARRAAEGELTIKDLLLYSAVCGTGLDTVPLPGDVTADQMAALLLDLCALAIRLDKPLTARLMPIPGKKAGDPTDFEFAFFANSKVMALHAAELGAVLSGEERFQLQPED
jgi:uncharacterized protein (UPF0210 family)